MYELMWEKNEIKLLLKLSLNLHKRSNSCLVVGFNGLDVIRILKGWLESLSCKETGVQTCLQKI